MTNICKNWDLAEYPYINLSPDDSVSEANRAWQGCPSIAITHGGRLFAAWYTGGAHEPCIENYNLLVMSEDKGQSWSRPLLTVGSDTERKLRKIDLQLWVTQDNALWLCYVTSPYYETSKPASIRYKVERDYQREFPYTEVMVCRDPDANELIWERPRVLCEGFLRNKPILTNGGRIIAPAYDYTGEDYMLRYSDDGGEHFSPVAIKGKPECNVYDEISVFENAHHRLRLLARTKKGYYAYADSFDGGNHWSDAEAYEKAPSTRCYIGTLRDGTVAYVRNIDNEQRTGLKLCLSANGGDSFFCELVLDERADVSYPDLDEDTQGNLYIIYDRERDNRKKLNTNTWTSDAAKEILLCRIDASDRINARLSNASCLQQVISKAEIDIAY